MRDARSGTTQRRVKVRARKLDHRQQQIVHNARELVQARAGSSRHKKAARTLAHLDLNEHEHELASRAAKQHEEHLRRQHFFDRRRHADLVGINRRMEHAPSGIAMAARAIAHSVERDVIQRPSLTRGVDRIGHILEESSEASHEVGHHPLRTTETLTGIDPRHPLSHGPYWLAGNLAASLPIVRGPKFAIGALRAAGEGEGAVEALRAGRAASRRKTAADKALTKFRKTPAGKQAARELEAHPVRTEVHRQIDSHPELRPSEKRTLKRNFDNEVHDAVRRSGKTVDDLLNDPLVRPHAEQFAHVPKTPEEVVASRIRPRDPGREGLAPVGAANPELRASVARALEGHDVDVSVFRQADIDPIKFADLIARGEPGRFWYEDSGKRILETAHGNRELADRIAQLVAVYSAQRAPVENVQLAINAFHEWQRTGKVSSFGTGPQIAKANQILVEGVPWEGLKTDRFYGNLLEEIDPEKYAAMFPGGEVTNDIWMARLFGLKTDNPTRREYDVMTGIVQKIADELGWKPKQVQAALWVAKKAEHEGTSIEQAAIDFSTALHAETAHLPFEVAPGVEVAPTLHAQYLKLSPEARREYTAQKAALVDEFLDEVGVFGRVGHEGVGVYEGQINPGWTVYIPAARGKGAEFNTAVAPHGTAELDSVAAAIGQAFHQDAAAWFKPFYKKSIAPTHRNGVKAILGRGMTEDEAVALERSFSSAGHEVAIVHDADGVHFLNLDSEALPNRDFHKVVGDATEGVFGDARMLTYASDGNYITKESYAAHLGRDAGERSDLYGAASLRLEERGADIDHAFLSEPGAGGTGPRLRPGGDGLSSGLNPGFDDDTERGLIGDWFHRVRGGDETPPPAADERDIEALDKAQESLKGAQTTRLAQDALRREEVGRRAGLAEEAMAGVQGLEAKIRAAKTELEGALPKLEFKGVRGLSEAEVDRVAELIEVHPDLRFFERMRAMDAIRNAWAAGTVPTKSELALLRKALGPRVTAEAFKPSKLQKIRSGVFEVTNMPRSLMASFDVSAPFRQGLVAFGRHPMLTAKNLGPMMKYLGSEHGYQDLMRTIDASPNRDLYAKAKLAITDVESLSAREEQYMSNLAERVTGFGKKDEHGHYKYSPVRASGRAYTGFLVKTRADMFDHLIEQAGHMGHDIEDPKLLHDLGAYINAATGRGGLGKLEGAAVALNSTFFSPRLMASRFTFLNPMSYIGLHPFVRRQKLRAAFQTAGAVSAVLWLGSQAVDAKVGLDPFSADFGKLRFGDTRVDITGGFAGYVRMLGTVGMATTGRDPDRKAQDSLVRFFRGKLAPVPAVGTDIALHTDYTGYQAPNVSAEVRELFIPLIIQDTMKVIHNDESVGKIVGSAAASAVGFGVNTYKDQPKSKGKSRTEKEDDFTAKYEKRFGRPLPAPVAQAQRTKDMYQEAERRRKDELGVSKMTDEQRTYVKLAVLGSTRPDLRPAIRNFRGLLDQSANEEAQNFIDSWAEENLNWGMLEDFHSMLKEASG